MSVKKRFFWQSTLFCAILLGVVIPAGAISPGEFTLYYYGSDVNIDFVKELESPLLKLDNEILDINLTGPDYLDVFGVFFKAIEDDEGNIEESSGTLVMENGSSLKLRSNHVDSITLTGINMVDFAHPEVLLDQASTVSVTASATEEALATGLFLGGTFGAGTATVSLDNNSTIITEAAGSFLAAAVGVEASADRLEVTLDNASTISAKADDLSYGLYAEVSNLNLTLDNGSFITTESSSGFGDIFGVFAKGDDSGDMRISLDNQSKIEAKAVSGRACGLYLRPAAVTEVTMANNSVIQATVITPYIANATGIWIRNIDKANIDLTKGSKIVARAQTIGTGLAISYGLLNQSTTTLSLDATSSISADYAVYDYGGQTDRGQTTIHNSGLLAGRLKVAAINNSNSGVLQATFGSADNYAYTGGGYDFYFLADTANLAAGSTLRINPTDNLGLNVVGDTVSYALLQTEAAGGSWNQADLQLTSTDSSSLLGLTWHEASTSDRLIATATFLRPVQAGLSGNATRAFEAAMTDDLFSFATDPSAWVPDVSGAFLAGMTQSLANSQVNIGNRLGGLLGLNSGDEVTADKGMWFSARYTGADQSRRDGVAGFDADTMAFSIGHDREFKNGVLGLAYTYGDSDADADDGRSDFDMDDHLFSLYGSYDAVTWYGEAIVSIGFGSVDGNRVNGGQVYRSDFDSNSYNAKVEAGMKLAAKSWQINPLATLEYSRKTYDSYTESGDDLALHIGSQDYDVLKLGAGAKAHREFLCSLGWVRPEFYALLSHDLITDRIVATANFIGGNTSFVAKGIEPSRTSWDLGAAVTLSGLEEENLSFRFGYDYSGREDFQAHSVTGKIRIEF